jgi:hypothetical protein
MAETNDICNIRKYSCNTIGAKSGDIYFNNQALKIRNLVKRKSKAKSYKTAPFKTLREKRAAK